MQQRDSVRWARAVLLLVVLWTPRLAAEPAELYVSAALGGGHAPNGGAGETHVDFDLGRPIALLAVGVDTGTWRFELDGGYRFNDAEVIFFDDARADVAPNTDSRISAVSLGVNAIRSFPLGAGLRTYLGIGVGGARIDYELTEYITERPLLDDHDSVLSYQWLAGFELPLTRRLDFSGEYRAWYAPDIALTDVSGAAFDTDHEVRSVTVGLRYRPGRASAGGGDVVARPVASAGWYLAAAAGPSFARDAEIKDNIANFDAFDVGPFVALGAGYDFPGPWRVEVELARRRHEAELVDFNPEFGEDRASGRVRSDSVLVNLAYQPRWRLPFQPYFALGAGMAWADWEVRLDTDGSIYVDDDDSAAAVQLVMGASAALTPRLQAVAEYRYWMTGLFDMAQPEGRPLRTELAVHGAMLGLRYFFR